ncbi:galactose/glucose ABC transporter substrate-binding protein MglB [Dapis sp. BLCC M229]|uniref:galactose/glucose ABC transporter substrate-binding protein MglB n=1 Tax=Dapis sp. BLCC M229 TaxID=3400188 RepID=UPI003CF631B9
MRKSLLIVSILISLLFTGCRETSSNNKEDLTKIGVTIYKYDDNFMSYVRRYIESSANAKATLFMNDSQNNQAKQLEQVDTMIAKGVKALAINLVDPKSATTVIAKARKANLPVIFFNKEPESEVLNSYEKSWYVGTDSKESGIMQGKIVTDSWNKNKEQWDRNKDGKIQYVLLKGEPGHPDAEARTKYVIDEVKNAGIGVEELAIDTAMWDATKAADKMDVWISKYGNKIEFVIANNDAMALGALSSLEKAGYFKDNKVVPIVGVDAIPEVLIKIREGKIIGTVLNDAKNHGKATFDLAFNTALGKDVLEGTKWKLDANKAVRVPYILITKDNLNVAEEAYN